ncbi:MAG TPA: sugar ABC transporter substrate-binding protein [Solirubrobacteraceae bacterium]
MAVLAVLAACGSSDNDNTSSAAPSTASTSSAAKKQAKIAYLIATQAAGYPQGMLAAAKPAAEKAGATMKIFDAQFDPGKQVSQCQDAVASKKYNVIITLPAASPPMTVCAKAAKAAGIPLIATNTPVGSDLASGPPTVDGVNSQVLIPAETAYGATPGKGLHDLLIPMCKKIKGTCTIAYIQGVRALALTAAADSSMKQLVKENGWKLAGTCEGGYQRQGGLKCMQNLLQKNPDINVLFSQSDDMANGAEQAMKAAGKTPGKDILIGTQGGSDKGIANIRSGRWYGSILSLAEPEGRIPVELAAKVVNGESIPNFVDPNKATGAPLVLDQTNKDKYPDIQGQFHS